MTHFVKKYTLRPDGQLAHLDAPAGACFVAAQHEGDGHIAIWLAVDSSTPTARATFLVLRDEEGISKAMAESLVHLATLFQGIEATHLFLVGSQDNAWELLDTLITKQITPDPEDKKEDS